MRIEMFGGLRVLYGESASLRPRSRQAETLLATLALRPGRSFSREELIQRLWPNVPSDIARSRFKQELSALRRTLAPAADAASALVATPQGIHLDPSELTTDTADFEACLHASASLSDPRPRVQVLEQAVLYVRGPLLPGSYDSHLLLERERLTEAYGEALYQLARLYALEGEMSRAVQTARDAVQSDPLREETRCDLIRFSLLSGFPADAVAQIGDYRALLMQQLGETLPPRLRALARLAQRFASTQAPAAQSLRSLSSPLYKLLHTIACWQETGKLADAIDAADIALLEQAALLHELGLLESEPTGSVIAYRLLPELKELLEIPL